MQVDLANNLIPKYIPKETKSVRIHFEFENDKRKMTTDEFWEFCAENRKVRAELTKEGDVIVMPPTGFETSDRNAEIITQVRIWAKKTGQGKVTDSNGGFILPNGAIYAPDASWTNNERLEKFTDEEKKKFLPLCPDFVIELRSESDNLSELKNKMEEYVENGAKLAWLIDPKKNEVTIYHQNGEIETLESPKTISGEDILVGFELDLSEIW